MTGKVNHNKGETHTMQGTLAWKSFEGGFSASCQKMAVNLR
jgi:hypothetical protein